jgi:hypothetical protein
MHLKDGKASINGKKNTFADMPILANHVHVTCVVILERYGMILQYKKKSFRNLLGASKNDTK